MIEYFFMRNVIDYRSLKIRYGLDLVKKKLQN